MEEDYLDLFVEYPREVTPPPMRSPPRPGDRVERVARVRGAPVSPPIRRAVVPQPAHRFQVAAEPRTVSIIDEVPPPPPPPTFERILVTITQEVPGPSSSTSSSSAPSRKGCKKFRCPKCDKRFWTEGPMKKHAETCDSKRKKRNKKKKTALPPPS